ARPRAPPRGPRAGGPGPPAGEDQRQRHHQAEDPHAPQCGSRDEIGPARGRGYARIRGMRILVLSDLHYKLPHYDWLVEAAGRVDAVAIVGDLADVVSPVPHDVQTVVVSNSLTLLADKTTVFAASGNHDLDGPGAHGEQVAAWLRRVEHASLH